MQSRHNLVNHASRVSTVEARNAKASENRALRYKLRKAAAITLDGERVCTCGVRAVSEQIDLQAGETGSFFAGVETCGSVWTCSVCASKIATKRKEEVAELMRCHSCAGGFATMFALTIPHQKIHTCQETKELVAETWKKVLSSRKVRDLREQYDLKFVRALEVTYGENGWHPHLHILAFPRPGTFEGQINDAVWVIFEEWAKRVFKAGYGHCNPVLFKPETTEAPEAAADYVTKWGADCELAMAHIKRARGGGRNPWDLLRDIADGDHEAKEIFREYAATFKGARQLTYSKGLREQYDLREIDDDEIVVDGDAGAESIGHLPRTVPFQLQKRNLEGAFFAYVHTLWKANQSRDLMADIESWLLSRRIKTWVDRDPGDAGYDPTAGKRPAANSDAKVNTESWMAETENRHQEIEENRISAVRYRRQKAKAYGRKNY